MPAKDLSILIPARNEMFLARTIEDITNNIEADTEVIAVLDGQLADPPIPQHPKVNIIYLSKSIGQRASTNLACKLSRAKYVMKVDAHCSFDKGFDRKMIESFKGNDDATMVPVMRNLWAFDWKCYHCGWKKYQGPTPLKCESCGKVDKIRRKMVWIGKHNPQSTSYCFDSTPHFQYFEDWKHRPQYQKDKQQTGLTQTMSLQGSCWMLTRDKYRELNICDENFGSWGSQGIEVAVKTWLSGGQVLVNHNTWYAHLFRTQGGDFGFPYPISTKDQEKAKSYARDLFFNNNWPLQKRPLSWLIEKFWPVKGWTQEDLDNLKTNTFTFSKTVSSQPESEPTEELPKAGLIYNTKELKPLQKSQNLVPNFKVFMPVESIVNAVATLQTDWIGGDGPRVKEFEQSISKIIQNNNLFAVNSGTSALQLALKLIGVKGGEVVTTPMTCIATNAAIVNEGATPVWTDIDPETGNIDPYAIAKNITKRTKAIMIVHWGGSPCDIDLINKIASIYSLPVIEDAAQALGSQYNSKPIGSHSDFVAFSTQAIKMINTIDGGILATKKASDTKRGKTLRWYGIDREERKWDDRGFFWDYPVQELGVKAQMTDLEASIGLGQLPYLEGHLAHREQLANLYQDALKNSKALKAQRILPNAKSNYWMFTVICSNEKTKQNLWQALNDIGVKAEEGHRRNDTYPVFKQYSTHLPGVDFFDKNHLIIPIGHWVSKKTGAQIADILANL